MYTKVLNPAGRNCQQCIMLPPGGQDFFNAALKMSPIAQEAGNNSTNTLMVTYLSRHGWFEISRCPSPFNLV